MVYIPYRWVYFLGFCFNRYRDFVNCLVCLPGVEINFCVYKSIILMNIALFNNRLHYSLHLLEQTPTKVGLHSSNHENSFLHMLILLHSCSYKIKYEKIVATYVCILDHSLLCFVYCHLYELIIYSFVARKRI